MARTPSPDTLLFYRLVEAHSAMQLADYRGCTDAQATLRRLLSSVVEDIARTRPGISVQTLVEKVGKNDATGIANCESSEVTEE